MNFENQELNQKNNMESERDINKDIEQAEKFEKMQSRLKVLEELGDNKDEEESDEYYVLKGRIERAENDSEVITSWDNLLLEHRNLSTVSFQGDGNSEDEIIFLPNGKAVHLEKIADYDYDTSKYQLIDRGDAKEMLEKGKEDFEKQIEKLNKKKTRIEEELKKL